MTVKNKRGRRRYVAFTTGENIGKDELIKRLNLENSESYVIQCSEGWAILRTDPKGCDSTISTMKKVCPESKSLTTSGTLRTIRTKYPELQRLRPRKNKS